MIVIILFHVTYHIRRKHHKVLALVTKNPNRSHLVGFQETAATIITTSKDNKARNKKKAQLIKNKCLCFDSVIITLTANYAAI